MFYAHVPHVLVPAWYQPSRSSLKYILKIEHGIQEPFQGKCKNAKLENLNLLNLGLWLLVHSNTCRLMSSSLFLHFHWRSFMAMSLYLLNILKKRWFQFLGEIRSDLPNWKDYKLKQCTWMEKAGQGWPPPSQVCGHVLLYLPRAGFSKSVLCGFVVYPWFSFCSFQPYPHPKLFSC